MAAMLRRVRSRSEAWRSSCGCCSGDGGSGKGGEGREGDSGMAVKAWGAMERRVRSMRDIRGCGFFTGEGVASPIVETIWAARASSVLTYVGSRTGGSEGK
jgi:hypothetical protein